MSFPLRPLTRWLLPPPACLLCAARSDQPPRPLLVGGVIWTVLGLIVMSWLIH